MIVGCSGYHRLCDKWTHIFAPDDIYLPLGVLTYVSSEAKSTAFSGRGSVSRTLFMPSVTLARYARSTVNSSPVVSKCNLVFNLSRSL